MTIECDEIRSVTPNHCGGVRVDVGDGWEIAEVDGELDADALLDLVPEGLMVRCLEDMRGWRVFRDWHAPSREELEELADTLRSWGYEVRGGGDDAEGAA